MRIQRAEQRIVELALTARSGDDYRRRLLAILFEAFGTDRGAVGAGHGGYLVAATLSPDHDVDLRRLMSTSLRDLSLESFRQATRPSSAAPTDPVVRCWHQGQDAHWIALSPPVGDGERAFRRRALAGLSRLAPTLRLGAQLHAVRAPRVHERWPSFVHPHRKTTRRKIRSSTG
jgi:hypothetical protein